jgi:hypothetical protein
VLAAHGLLQRLELLEAGHFGQAVGGAPGGDGGQLQLDGIGAVGAGRNDRLLHLVVAGLGGVLAVAGHGGAVAAGVVHQPVEGRVGAGELHVRQADAAEAVTRAGRGGARLGDGEAEGVPALLGDRLQQLGLVLEVVIGRGRTDASLPGHRAQRQRRGSFGLEDAAGGVHQRAAEIAVVVRAGLGVSSFSHCDHRKI